MVSALIPASAAAAFAGVILLVVWHRSRIRVVSQDMVLRGRGTLSSAALRLAGRPDEILRVKGGFVPVEHKSGMSNGSPREWDVAQLLAYCLLVEENMGRVTEGQLVYPDSSYAVPWNDQNRVYLTGIIQRMREGRSRKTAQLGKCTRCEFRSYCGRA